MAKKPPNKGFKRSQKEWEESIVSHVGKLIDRLDPFETVMLVGTAYAGYRAIGSSGIVVGPLGYKLATTMGGTPPASQIAGLLILSGIGLIAVSPELIKILGADPEKAKELTIEVAKFLGKFGA